MARLPRVYIEGAIYYVTATSSESRELFIDHKDYQEYLSLIIKNKNQFGFKLFSYALMPNHIHMLVELKNNIEISRIMHSINSLYTKIFNGRYGKKGHVFQERFKALIAQKDPYLVPLIRHIHLSPRRAKIEDDPKSYPHSSHSLYVDPIKRKSIELYPDMQKEVQEVFKVLKGDEETFDSYVADTDRREADLFRKSLYRKRVLGSKMFSERIAKAIEKAARDRKRAKLPKRLQMMYAVIGSAAILVFVVTVNLFYRHNVTLKTSQDKTIAVYESTLRLLEQEREKAVKTKQDVEQYMWKIKLTEDALKKAQAEKEKELAERRMIEGYSWTIELRQTSGPKNLQIKRDKVSIDGRKIRSSMLVSEGFNRSNYSRREKRKGEIVIWETMQIGPDGAMANWRGEWDGNIMRGVLRKKGPDGVIRDFSFRSVGERVKIKN